MPYILSKWDENALEAACNLLPDTIRLRRQPGNQRLPLVDDHHTGSKARPATIGATRGRRIRVMRCSLFRPSRCLFVEGYATRTEICAVSSVSVLLDLLCEIKIPL